MKWTCWYEYITFYLTFEFNLRHLCKSQNSIWLHWPEEMTVITFRVYNFVDMEHITDPRGFFRTLKNIAIKKHFQISSEMQLELMFNSSPHFAMPLYHVHNQGGIWVIRWKILQYVKENFGNQGVRWVVFPLLVIKYPPPI